MPDSLSLVGSLFGGPIAGLPIKAGLSEFLPASTGVLIAGGSHSSVRRSLRTTLTAQARQKCTVHGRRTVARRRKRSLSDKSTNVAISARRREISFTLPGLLVHGCRARGKRCQTEEAPLSWKRMSDSGDDELKRRYLLDFDYTGTTRASIESRERRKLSLITAQAKQSQR